VPFYRWFSIPAIVIDISLFWIGLLITRCFDAFVCFPFLDYYPFRPLPHFFDFQGDHHQLLIAPPRS